MTGINNLLPTTENPPGKLLVLEGVEGCGKTTQLELLRQWLLSLPSPPPVVVTREPGGTTLGGELRRLLLMPHEGGELIQPRSELLMYAADRAQHVDGFILPHLHQGAVVLCDRFTDSTIAYQGYGRGFSLQIIDELNFIATGGLQSDLTLWLDLDVEVGLNRSRQRGPSNRLELETLAFHRRVQQGYRELAQTYPQRIRRIDASQPPEAVTAQIQAVLTPHLHKWGIVSYG
ncbi:dTMP kinase [[Phormidium] sp. ETS-05]|uniref:dTMP kinase n=1 Tax=[Phormidium] sp. ETS-05 TaxID=222819 RepID=UPI0018EF233D|nr:dTMP kinase [[Phormidium] sp. ETS-05]